MAAAPPDTEAPALAALCARSAPDAFSATARATATAAVPVRLPHPRRSRPLRRWPGPAGSRCPTAVR